MTDARALLAELTPQQAKIDAYSSDTYFLETVDRLGQSEVGVADFAHTHTLLLLKPDAIAARAMQPTFDWLHDNGFGIVSARRVPVNRHLVRALWYFQWNIASDERRRLADMLVTMSDSMVLVLRSTPGDVPTSIALTHAKGPTDPRQREPGQLRHLLGRHSYLLNLVHSPDDPADVLRELAIYFDGAELDDVLADVRVGRDRIDDAVTIARGLADEVPERSFDRSVALATLVDQARLVPGTAAVADSAATGSDDASADLLYTAWRDGWSLDPWSTIVLGSYVLPMRVGTASQTLGAVTVDGWRDRFTYSVRSL